MTQRPRITLSALMHGRHDVTRECFTRNVAAGFDHFVFAYTLDADRRLLVDMGVDCVFAENTILGKAQASLNMARDAPCEAVMLMGNDDYVNLPTLDLIRSLLPEHDYIAFSSILFRTGDKFTLWPGYDNRRAGEPAGAGRVVRADLLDALDWDLFRGSRDVGGDLHVHERLMSKSQSPLFIGVSEGAYLVDIKDKDSTTNIRRFFNLNPIQVDREALML